MRRGRGLLLLVVAAVLLVCACATATTAHAASASYVLQRRLGSEGAWQTVTTFALKQKRQLPPRLVVSSSAAAASAAAVNNESAATTAATVTLSRENKSALVTADVVYYRVLPTATTTAAAANNNSSCNDASTTTAAATAPVAMIAVTPCTVIRGFDAVDSRTVVLREQLRVVPGAGVGVVGLQVSSNTNMFHSKMQNGDECDRSIVERLFPVVRVVTELGLLRPVEPVTTVRYDDLRLLSAATSGGGAHDKNNGGGGAAGAAAGAATTSPRGGRPARMKTRKVRNAKGEVVEEDVPVEEQSFLQKYWLYIAVGIGMTVMRSMKG